jgi:hypothetical protein
MNHPAWWMLSPIARLMRQAWLLRGPVFSHMVAGRPSGPATMAFG